MSLAEVNRALRQLRVSGMAATIEPRIVQAQADHWAPLDLVAALVRTSCSAGRTGSWSAA